jgi:hypothetical protein
MSKLTAVLILLYFMLAIPAMFLLYGYLIAEIINSGVILVRATGQL